MSLDLTAGPTVTTLAPAPPTRVPAGTAPAGRPITWSTAQLAAVGPAVARDLDRLMRVLAEPITPVRRTALVGHVSYLADQLCSAHPALADRQAGALSRFRLEARRWSSEPVRRPALLAATARTAAALVPAITGVDRASVASTASVAGSGAATAGPGEGPLPGGLLPQRPTTLAYRHFWLLDDLPPDLAGPLTGELTGPVRWVLRNVFSGGYNRRAYLMWVGGGSGPAV